MSGDEKPNKDDLCNLCNENVSKYCCPRCNVLYCSLDCYKSNQHIKCSESFYKECIDQELKSLEPDPKVKNGMLEILSRTYRNDCDSKETPENIDRLLEDSDSDDEDIINISSDCEEVKDSDDEDSLPDLVERMRDINLDDAEKVWEALSFTEKKEFEELIKSEDISKILSLWEPWWSTHYEDVKIEEVNSKVKEEPYISLCPPILKNVKDFSQISCRKPASCVKYNLFNILASYVYIARLFNGEHNFFDREAVCCLHSICKNLIGNVNFDDASTAVLSVVQECYNNPSIITDADTKRHIISDLQHLFHGPDKRNKAFYILSALSDLHFLLIKNKANYNKAETNGSKALNGGGEFSKKFTEHDMLELPQPTKKEMSNYIKKIEYFVSYMKSFSSEVTTSVFIVV